MKLDLKEWVVIITGASQGIGAATAHEFSKNGSTVVLAARSIDLIEKLAKEINDSGGNAFPVKTDVSCQEEIKNLGKAVLDKYGKIDAWINNAGFSINYNSLFVKESWAEQIFNVNLNAVYWGMRTAAHAMMRNRSHPRGMIVNVSSISSEIPVIPNSVLYKATKVAVDTMSEGVALELASLDIRIINIKPGFTATNFHNNRKGPKKEVDINAGGYLFFKSVTPEVVAKKIVTSVQKGKSNSRVLATVSDSLAIFVLKIFFPLTKWIIKRTASNQKPDPLLED